jgi:hypothetical protein
MKRKSFRMTTATRFRHPLFVRLQVSLVLSIVAAAVVFSQTAGNSDPAGFLSVAVNGTGGVGANRMTYLGLGLTRSVAYQRTASVIGANSITDSGASWTVDQFAGANGPHFVEITNVNGSITATGVGTTYGIVSNTSSTLTLASNLAAGIAAPVGYKIRKQWTIATVFGPNDESGLQGGTAATADLAQLWNGATLDSYYYQTAPSVGWRRVGDTGTDTGGTLVPFYSAVVITRQQSGNLTFVLNGTVKTGQTAIPIVVGDNYVGNVYPANLTLATSGLYTGNTATGLAGGDAATADQVRIWNATVFDIYYYQTSGVGGTGWRKVGAPSTDAGNTIIAESSGFVINRRSSPNFNWVVPETLIGQTGTPTPAPTATPGVTPSPTPITPTPTPGVTPITPTPTPGVTPSPTPVTPTPTPGVTPVTTPTPGVTPTPSPASQAVNLSTRMRVQGGENVGIGGFIITGSAPKHVLLRAIGPSLAQFGVPNPLADPVLELHGPSGFTTVTNDNWREDPAQEVAIMATGLAPTNNLESAIDATLNPGTYTAIVMGKNNTSGVGLIEVYDLSPAVPGQLGNISTRAFVSSADDIVIAGFILGGSNGDDRIVVRGIGPSLAAVGVTNVLANPMLELHDSNGTVLLANNNWQDDAAQAAQLNAAGLAPTNNLESALAATLSPGLYTALLSGVNNGTGVGLVEVYDLP